MKTFFVVTRIEIHFFGVVRRIKISWQRLEPECCDGKTDYYEHYNVFIVITGVKIHSLDHVMSENAPTKILKS